MEVVTANVSNEEQYSVTLVNPNSKYWRATDFDSTYCQLYVMESNIL